MAERIRKGKKHWVRIVGPREFGNSILGESYVYDSKDLIGKRLKVNLAMLMGDMKRQNVSILFKIKENKGAEVYAEIVAYEMSLAHLRRIIRAGRDKLDDSFDIESKDKLKLRIKLIILTRNKINNSILTKIRGAAEGEVSKSSMKTDFKTFLDEVISGRLQKSLRQDLSKIYPISAFEVRKLEILNR